MKIKIQVSNSDISKGLPESFEMCPIALALKREITKHGVILTEISVSDSIISFRTMYDYWEGEPSKRLSKFVRKFDSYQKVSPSNFTVQLEPRV
jgi:hypothetical protein